MPRDANWTAFFGRDREDPGAPRTRFLKGVAWSFLGTVIGRSFGLISSVVVARVIGKVTYGELGMIISTISMLSVFGGLGLGLTATKHVAEFRRRDPSRAGRICALVLSASVLSYGLASLALFFLAEKLATSTLQQSDLATDLRIASLYLLLNGIDGVLTGVLAGLEAFSTLALVNLLRGAIGLPVTVAAVLMLGRTGAVVSLVIAMLIGVVVTGRALMHQLKKAGISISFRGSLAESRVLWHSSLPGFVAGLSTLPAMWVVNAMLVSSPSGYGEMGTLTAAMQWQSVVIVVPLICSVVGVSVQSDLLGKGDTSGLRSVFTVNLLLQVGGAAIVAILMCLFAEQLMAVYGSDFSTGRSALRILAVGWTLMTLRSVIWDLLVSAGRFWFGCLCSLLGAGVLVGSSFRLITYGAGGVATAVLLSHAVVVIAQVLGVYFSRSISERPRVVGETGKC